jgi:hypothetical protein
MRRSTIDNCDEGTSVLDQALPWVSTPAANRVDTVRRVREVVTMFEFVGPPLTRDVLASVLVTQRVPEHSYHLYGAHTNDAFVLDQRSEGVGCLLLGAWSRVVPTRPPTRSGRVRGLAHPRPRR